MAKRSPKPKESTVTEKTFLEAHNELEQQQQESVQDQQQEATETPNVSVDIVNQPSVDTAPEQTVTESSTTVNQPVRTIKTLEDFIEIGTFSQKTLVETLFRYRDSMFPKKMITEADGVLQQYYLWKAIQGVVCNSSSEEFNTLWSILLAFAQRHKDDVFHDKYVHRFAHRWNWSADELEGFQNIINLIKVTADPEKRKTSVKTVSLEKTMAKGFTEDAKQRISVFYSR